MVSGYGMGSVIQNLCQGKTLCNRLYFIDLAFFSEWKGTSEANVEDGINRYEKFKRVL
jgi:hypothetical protein